MLKTSESKSENISPWETIKSDELFSSPWLTLNRETCRLPSGRIIDDYYTLTLPDGVAIVAVTVDKQIVLVRQYKQGLGRVVLELPAGNVESEDIQTAIQRELEEETGYIADSVEYVTTLASKPARMKTLTHIFFATDVTCIGAPQQEDIEFVETVLVPLSELFDLIRHGEIITETSLAAILAVWDRLH